jgi:hypothetical protein
MTSEERLETRVVGTVTATWTTFCPVHITPSAKTLENKAVSELRAAAQRQGYTGNIDIRNVSVAGNFHGGNIPWAIFTAMLFGNFQKVVASGDVVEYGTSSGTSSSVQRRLAEAVKNASTEMAERILVDSTIAVLAVYSSDRDTSEYIIGELEYNFVNTGRFRIVDRRRLDQIRTERNFQLSGEVSDDTAVSIGNMLGANIVITGEITGTGSNQRLILKALDVRTAQIITMAREQI